MVDYDTAAVELAAVLFFAAAIPLAFVARWVVRRFRLPAFPVACLVFILSLCAAAYALADGEPGKPAPPQVMRWVRFKKDWARWTNEVKHEWAEFCEAVRQGFISVQGLYGDTIEITNNIPRNVTPPKVMQLRMNNLANPRNENFKARPTRLNDNGDGTWTVEITMSREVSDEPALMMYLRRRSDGKVWWVEHSATSYPTNSNVNAYTYTFQMPVGIEGCLAVADEVLLGGPNGLTVEGLALVDLDSGMIYEGVNGDYIDADGRPLQVRGGVFTVEQNKAAAEEPEQILMKNVGGRIELNGAAVPLDAPKIDFNEPPLKLAIPPVDSRRAK